MNQKCITLIKLLSFNALIFLFVSCSTDIKGKSGLVEKVLPDSLSIINDTLIANRFSNLVQLKDFGSAYEIAKVNSNDSIKAKQLSTLSYKLLKVNDSQLFKEVNYKAIQLNQKLLDSTSLAENYWDLGDFYNNQMLLDSAYATYYEAQKIYESLGNYLKSGKLLLNMATTQSNIKDYVGSEATTTKAIEQLKPLKNKQVLFRGYNQLGITSGALGEPKKALDFFNEALYYAEQGNDDAIRKSKVFNNIGVVLRNNNNNQHLKAIEYFKITLNTDSLKFKNPSGYAKTLSNLAKSKLALQDTLDIYKILIESIEIKTKQNDLAGLASSYLTLAKYKAYAKDTLQALALTHKAKEFAVESSNNERLLKIWNFLVPLEKENAPYYMQKYVELNESLQTEERRQRNIFARIRFETNEVNQENLVLESQKESLAKEKQIWTGIAAGFFLLGLSVYIIINQRAKNQKLLFDQQQQANNQEIFNLMLSQKQKVDEGKRVEQKRISEELHDGVLGKMLGARMVLTGLNKKATEEAITEKTKALSSLQDIENEIRAISHELSHNAYRKINNFTDSIQSLLSNNYGKSKIDTYFNFNEDEDWDSLAGEIKINVYRIIQEVFQNAIKHANCKSFTVNFDRSDDNFNIILIDDGQGFILDKEKKGIGMRNIKSRIRKLNGYWHINSDLGKGTTVTLQIPIT